MVAGREIEIRFTLYARSYCHLCDQMIADLQAFKGEFEYSLDVRDVDDDPRWVAQYDELVPVLLGSKDGREPERLCHYALDASRVRNFLLEVRQSTSCSKI